MGYLKVDDNAADHPKLAGLTDAAFRVWFRGCCYAARLATDGFIPAAVVEGWTRRPALIVGELLRAVLWHQAEGGYQIHDFLHWNDSAELRRQRIAAKADRQARWKAGRRTGDASSSRHERRAGDAPPTPTPTPTPSTKSGEVVPMPRYMRGPTNAHATCVTGCQFGMCLPEQLAMDLAKRLPGGFTEQGLADTVAWANSVIDDRVARGLGMPDRTVYEFWKNRWAEQFGGSAPSFAQLRAKRAEDALGAAFNG